MRRYWVCIDCGEPCRLVFHEEKPGATVRNLRGSDCCDALVRTRQITDPVQPRLVVVG